VTEGSPIAIVSVRLTRVPFPAVELVLKRGDQARGQRRKTLVFVLRWLESSGRAGPSLAFFIGTGACLGFLRARCVSPSLPSARMGEHRDVCRLV